MSTCDGVKNYEQIGRFLIFTDLANLYILTFRHMWLQLITTANEHRHRMCNG